MRTTKSKIVAVLSAAVLVMGTFFIVRAVEKEKPAVKVEKTKVVTQQVWYDVNGSSENASDLQITSGPASLPKNQPTCNMTNAGLPCGVHLSFPNNDAPSSVPAGTTVQDLIDNYGASIVLDGLGDPEFTRKN